MLENPRLDRDQDISSDSIELLHELERSTRDAMNEQRVHSRIRIRAKVVVDPGNMSARDGRRFVGVTGDISTSGCQLLLAEPLRVGDFYRIEFDRETVDFAPVYARCVRARLVREDAFEAAMIFNQPADLTQALRTEDTK